MKKILWVIIIFLVLFGIVIGEQVYVDNTLNTLIKNIDTLNAKIENVTTINTQEINSICEDLDVFWTESEKIMCLFISHNDLNRVGEQIKRVKSYIKSDKKDECECEIETLKFYAESYRHVMEINIQNLL